MLNMCGILLVWDYPEPLVAVLEELFGFRTIAEKENGGFSDDDV